MAAQGDNAQATFRLALEDATSGPAASSAAALEQLRAKISDDTQALKGLQAALRNLKGGGVAADSAVKGLKDQIAAKKAVIAGTQAGLLQLGGGLTRAGAAARGAADGGLKGLGKAFAEISKHAEGKRLAEVETRTKAVNAALSYAGGPAAKYASALRSVGAFAFSLPGILIAVAAAIVAVTAATIAGTVALLRYGIATADARRNELLRLEGLAKVRNFWTGYVATAGNAAKTAAFLQENIDRVSGSVAIGRDQVAGYAEQLFRMGLRGRNLQDTLEGVAITAATQGDAAAQAFAGWAAGANLTGQSVRALAQDVKARLGDIAARQMLSLEVLSKKLHESFAMLFSGLHIEALGKGVAMITALFSQSTASGRALKTIIEALFQPLIDGAAEGAPVVKRFFQGIVIGALYATIAILKVRNWFRDTFGRDTTSKIDATKAALNAGIAVVGSLAAAFGLLAIAVAGVAAPFVLAGYALYKMVQIGGKVLAWWRGVDWSQLGTHIVQGLATGIARASTKAITAIADLARRVGRTFADALGIHSDSRLFMAFGVHTAGGLATGITRGAPRAEAAAQRMAFGVAAAGAPMAVGGYTDVGGFESASAAPTAAAPTRSNGAGASFHFAAVHVHASDEAGGRAAARGFRQELEELLMGVNVTLGGRTPAGA